MAGSGRTYDIRSIDFRGATRRVLCLPDGQEGVPLVALCNALLLQNRLALPEDASSLESQELVNMVTKLLMTVSPEGHNDQTKHLDKAREVLPVLQEALKLDCRFAGSTKFDPQPELLVFELLRVRLFHACAVSPLDKEVYSVCVHYSVSQLRRHLQDLDKVRRAGDGDRTTDAGADATGHDEALEDGAAVSGLREKANADWTYTGVKLLQEVIAEAEIAVFFWNRNFETLVRCEDSPYVLCSNSSLNGTQVVWKQLLGDSQKPPVFLDALFKPVAQHRIPAMPGSKMLRPGLHLAADKGEWEGRAWPCDDKMLPHAGDTACADSTDEVTPETSSAKTKLGWTGQEIYHLRTVKFLGRERRVLSGLEDRGTSPLAALTNVLLLRGDMALPKTVKSIASQELLLMVTNLLMENYTDSQMDSKVSRKQLKQTYDQATGVLPTLQSNLQLDCKFSGPQDFETQRELALFELLKVNVFHSWVVSSMDKEAQSAVGSLSHYQLRQMLADFERWEQPDMHHEGLEALYEMQVAEDLPVLSTFLQNTSSQVTYEGITRLKEAVGPDEVAFLYRSFSFDTLVRHEDMVLLLCTEPDLMGTRAVWKRLACASSKTLVYLDSDFEVLEREEEEVAGSPLAVATHMKNGPILASAGDAHLPVWEEEPAPGVQKQASSATQLSTSTWTKKDQFLVRRMPFLGSKRCVLCAADGLGTSPLQALCNVLLLQGRIPMPSEDASSVSVQEMIFELTKLLRTSAGKQSSCDKAVKVLPSFHLGLELDNKPSGPADFGTTTELQAFQLLGVDVFHGAVGSPEATSKGKSPAGRGLLKYLDDAKATLSGRSAGSSLTQEGLILMHKAMKNGTVAFFYRSSRMSATRRPSYDTVVRMEDTVFFLCAETSFMNTDTAWRQSLAGGTNEVYFNVDFCKVGAPRLPTASTPEKLDKAATSFLACQRCGCTIARIPGTKSRCGACGELQAEMVAS